MQKTAILLGATGLTGSHVLNQLLNNELYGTIKLFSRTSCGIDHPKIEEHLGDLLNLDQFREAFTGDEVYICIGTTKAKTPDREIYRAIDVGIPENAARLAKENGITKIAVVSAVGANSKSLFTYNRIKGDMERAVRKAKIQHTYIIRPSLIVGERKELRAGEKFSLALAKAFKFLIPKKYRAVKASRIARRMISLCREGGTSKMVSANKL